MPDESEKGRVVSENIEIDIESAHLRGGGRVLADAFWSFPSHSHDHWEFIYYTRGAGRVDTPGRTIKAREYHLVIFPPGLFHAESADPTNPEQTYFFGVDIPGTPAPDLKIFLPDPDGDMGWLVERIVKECQAGRRDEPLAQTYTRAFLYIVKRHWEDVHYVKDDIVDMAMLYVRDNYSQQFDLDDLAKAVNSSKTHLVHKFSKRLGISPMRYLQQVRIEAGKRLLSTTTIPVGEVATQVGFTDALYFSRAIRRATGSSPTEYRLLEKSAIQSI